MNLPGNVFSINGGGGSFAAPNPKLNPPSKKRRNQPGTPDPDAEVMALSPKTLMAANRFICEICNKGFQRDQNLQLHRRGHNLPWKLRQMSNKEWGRNMQSRNCNREKHVYSKSVPPPSTQGREFDTL